MLNGTDEDATQRGEPHAPGSRASRSRWILAVVVAGVATALLLFDNGISRERETNRKLHRCAEDVEHAVRNGAEVGSLGPLVEGQVDAWGQPLQMFTFWSAGMQRVHIVSVGQDGVWRTSDDLVVEPVLPPRR